ncbi:hypothetical protein [Streptomyces sp. NPDC088794]|uniref:hypothetical protein n=1 Tax=Streptomyces sp. NPDC088794 TaxID=3365902 RepID=UPI0038273FEA
MNRFISDLFLFVGAAAAWVVLAVLAGTAAVLVLARAIAQAVKRRTQPTDSTSSKDSS